MPINCRRSKALCVSCQKVVVVGKSGRGQFVGLFASHHADDMSLGRTYPPLDKIGEISLDIAAVVAQIAWDSGLACAQKPADVRSHIASLRFDPSYLYD